MRFQLGRNLIQRPLDVGAIIDAAALDADAFRARFLESLGVKGGGIDYRADVERALDEVAAELEAHLDCDAIFGLAR